MKTAVGHVSVACHTDRVYLRPWAPDPVRTLTAVDLFCGGGGLTEGFKQVGVDVEACLDIWGPAVETHRKNHPETEVFQADILNFDPSALPKCDILIGSPPCTEFSYANRGGHGDTGLGMRFVLRFLRFVHDLGPKYWIMENVPRLFQTLPSRVPLRRLGISGGGFLEIPVRRILNSADYGVPQKRLRLISGNFPLPEPTHTWADGLGAFSDLPPWVPVKTVLGLLPDPLGTPRRGALVHDPCYDLELPEVDLTEQFMDTRLTPDEVEVNRKSKTDHSWYGRMAFPDPLDRPARTVMATQTGISRETLVIEDKRGDSVFYRRPTIRECASFQSFPITYQFWGSTAQVRYKVIGNAVPPMMASAIARALLKKEGLSVPPTPDLSRSVSEAPSPVSLEPASGKRRGPNYPEGRKFRDHVPGSKGRGVRIDLANVVTEGLESDGELEVRWEARLILGSGKTVLVKTPTLTQSLRTLAASALSSEQRGVVDSFLYDLQAEVGKGMLDADGLQAAWSHRLMNPVTTPPSILSAVGRIVDRHFPEEGFRDQVAEIDPSLGVSVRRTIPVRAAAQLTGVAFIADSVTRGGNALDIREEFSRVESTRVPARGRRRLAVS